LMASIDYEIVHRIFKVQVRQEPTIERVEEQGVEVHEEPKLTSDNVQSIQPSSHPAIQPTSPTGGPSEKDSMEMTDEELDAEIARLEALEKGSQAVGQSGSWVITPDNPTPQISGNQPLKVTKIGRNDPCPCGSGLKWKKCGLINAPQHKG